MVPAPASRPDGALAAMAVAFCLLLTSILAQEGSAASRTKGPVRGSIGLHSCTGMWSIWFAHWERMAIGDAPGSGLSCNMRRQSTGQMERNRSMSVARVTEISSDSPTSFEDAIKVGLDRANKTLRGVKGAWIKEQQVVVENGAVSLYRVNMAITFVLDE
jgi:dodecin